MRLRQLIPNLITLTILFMGLQAILSSINEQYVRAAQFILLAGLLDGIDGEVARRVRGATKFGERLDSYVDTMSFAAAPAILVYQAVWRDYDLWGMLVAFAILASGVIRFSRSVVTQDRGHRHYFNGLPIPLSAMWMAMYILVSHAGAPDLREMFQYGPVSALMWICPLLFVILQVTSVPYVKPGRDALLLGSTSVLVLMLISGRPLTAAVLAYFVALFAYAFISPFFRHAPARAAEEEEEAVVKGRF